mgnify:CR=1 FL=1
MTKFTGAEVKGQMTVQVDYVNPSGRAIRLAEGILRGNPSTPFGSGLTIIDNATLERVYPFRNVTFLDKSLEDVIRRTKCLPPGEYNVCLSLYEAGAIDGNKPFLTQTCYTREVTSLSPLLLVSPFDEDEILTMLPLFSWTAVTPIIPEARYQIQMVELQANQTGVRAFRANPLYFSSNGLVSNIMQYPISARSLNPCSSYAWRVIYTLNEGVGGNDFLRRPNFLQESEIWTFRTACEEEEEEVIKVANGEPKDYYKPMVKQEAGFFVQRENNLRFELDNPYITLTNLSFRIIDGQGNAQAFSSCEGCCSGCGLESSDERGVREGSKSDIQHGKNYITMDLTKYNLKEGQIYNIVFIDFKHDLFLNFKYEPNEDDK